MLPDASAHFFIVGAGVESRQIYGFALVGEQTFRIYALAGGMAAQTRTHSAIQQKRVKVWISKRRAAAGESLFSSAQTTPNDSAVANEQAIFFFRRRRKRRAFESPATSERCGRKNPENSRRPEGRNPEGLPKSGILGGMDLLRRAMAHPVENAEVLFGQPFFYLYLAASAAGNGQEASGFPSPFERTGDPATGQEPFGQSFRRRRPIHLR